jgi:endo-1,4-beta-mannosidase
MILYQTGREEYFRRLDGVVRSAEKHGIGLVPSLFWYYACVPDLVGEPCDQWGNPQSKTHAWMRQYVEDVVTRYKDSPAIWMWEFGNEYSLGADIPGDDVALPAVVSHMLTARQRTERDKLTHAQVRVAFAEFAKAVRALDPYRLISTGDAFPRASAWHLERHDKWATDDEAQFAEMLALNNPDPVGVISLHAYDEKDLQRLEWAARVAVQTRKPLFVGEFGSGISNKGTDAMFRRLLKAILDVRAPLAALWVFDFASQPEWNVRYDNAGAWQLQEIARANAQYQQKVRK